MWPCWLNCEETDICSAEETVERIWHSQGSQGRIMALALRSKSLNRFQLCFPLRSEVRWTTSLTVTTGPTVPRTPAPQRGSNSTFSRPFFCTKGRQNPATSSTNQGGEKHSSCYLVDVDDWTKCPSCTQPSKWNQLLFLETPVVYHRSPESGDLQYGIQKYKLRGSKKQIEGIEKDAHDAAAASRLGEGSPVAQASEDVSSSFSLSSPELSDTTIYAP